MTEQEIEAMRADARDGTPGPWRLGNRFDSVVADHETGFDDDYTIKVYGGNLLCESVAYRANARRIARVPAIEAMIEAQAAEIARLLEHVEGIEGDLEDVRRAGDTAYMRGYDASARLKTTL